MKLLIKADNLKFKSSSDIESSCNNNKIINVDKIDVNSNLNNDKCFLRINKNLCLINVRAIYAQLQNKQN